MSTTKPLGAALLRVASDACGTQTTQWTQTLAGRGCCGTVRGSVTLRAEIALVLLLLYCLVHMAAVWELDWGADWGGGAESTKGTIMSTAKSVVDAMIMPARHTTKALP